MYNAISIFSVLCGNLTRIIVFTSLLRIYISVIFYKIWPCLNNMTISVFFNKFTIPKLWDLKQKYVTSVQHGHEIIFKEKDSVVIKTISVLYLWYMTSNMFIGWKFQIFCQKMKTWIQIFSEECFSLCLKLSWFPFRVSKQSKWSFKCDF